MPKIYALKLQKGKYYIGYTERTIIERFHEHLSGKGSSWTKKYHPIEIIECIDAQSKEHEKNMTLLYMRKYGWENVRGGAWCQIELKKPPVAILLTMTSEELNKLGCKMKECTECSKAFISNLNRDMDICYNCSQQ